MERRAFLALCALFVLAGTLAAQERMEFVTQTRTARDVRSHPGPQAIDAALHSTGPFARTLRLRGYYSSEIIVRGRNPQPGLHKWQWRDGRCEYWNEEGFLTTASWSRFLCREILSDLSGVMRETVREGQWIAFTVDRFILEAFIKSPSGTGCHLGFLYKHGVGWLGLRFSPEPWTYGTTQERLKLEDCLAVYDALTVVR